MPRLALDAGAVLLLILPGFLAYRFAVMRRADPTLRSPLWQVSEILEYSVYVHLFGIALFSGGLYLLKSTLGISSHVRELLLGSPQTFLENHFTEAIILLVTYAVYVILSSAILGAYDVPGIFANGLVSRVRRITKRLNELHKWLGWVPVPRDAYPDSPVWHFAFRDMTVEFSQRKPLLIVTMKNGDIYFGQLASYPVVPDTQYEKDFLITAARYYQGGDPNQERKLDLLDGIGAVLLNSANVESIRLYYQEIPPNR